MYIKINLVFLNRILFKTLYCKIFNQFIRPGNTIQEFYNLTIQFFLVLPLKFSNALLFRKSIITLAT